MHYHDPIVAARQAIEDIIGSPDASSFVRETLQAALSGDPIKRANEAEAIATLLATRADALLAEDHEHGNANAQSGA